MVGEGIKPGEGAVAAILLVKAPVVLVPDALLYCFELFSLGGGQVFF